MQTQWGVEENLNALLKESLSRYLLLWIFVVCFDLKKKKQDNASKTSFLFFTVRNDVRRGKGG
jgi:hypothetical protein